MHTSYLVAPKIELEYTVPREARRNKDVNQAKARYIRIPVDTERLAENFDDMRGVPVASLQGLTRGTTLSAKRAKSMTNAASTPSFADILYH